MYIANTSMSGLMLIGLISLGALVFGVETGRLTLMIFSSILIFWCVGLFIIGLVSSAPVVVTAPGDEFDDQDDDDEYSADAWKRGIKRYDDRL